MYIDGGDPWLSYIVKVILRTSFQTMCIEIGAAAVVRLAQVVAAAVWSFGFLQLEASVFTRSRGVDYRGVWKFMKGYVLASDTTD